MEAYEIGIVGGGMVGALAAKMLAPHFSVALIESGEIRPLGPVPDLRVSAFNTASIELLKAEQIFAKLDVNRLAPVVGMKVSNAAEEIHFRASESGALKLAYIIENEHLRAIIDTAFQASATGVKIQAACESLTQTPAGFELQISGQTPIQVKLLILAQGGVSLLAAELALPRVTHDYGQRAWVAHVKAEKPHCSQAYQRFLPGGPLAFLPLADPHYSSMVWTLPQHITLQTETLAQALEAVFPDLGTLEIIKGPLAFPLFAQHCQTYIGKGFALIGDAAHTVHPLAGQGVNLGFRDVKILVDVLSAAKANRQDFSAPSVLHKYASQVAMHNRLHQLSFSVINQLYKPMPAPLERLRDWGMGLVARQGILKRLLMKQAAGK